MLWFNIGIVLLYFAPEVSEMSYSEETGDVSLDSWKNFLTSYSDLKFDLSKFFLEMSEFKISIKTTFEMTRVELYAFKRFWNLFLYLKNDFNLINFDKW